MHYFLDTDVFLPLFSAFNKNWAGQFECAYNMYDCETL